MPSAPPSELPDDVAALRAIIAAQAEELAAARTGLTVKAHEHFVMNVMLQDGEGTLRASSVVTIPPNLMGASDCSSDTRSC